MKQSTQASKLVSENSKNLGNGLTGPFGHNFPSATSSMKLNNTKFCHNHSFLLDVLPIEITQTFLIFVSPKLQHAPE